MFFSRFHGRLICFALFFFSLIRVCVLGPLCRQPAPFSFAPSPPSLAPLKASFLFLFFFQKSGFPVFGGGRAQLATLGCCGNQVDAWTQSMRGQAEWEFKVALRGLSRCMYSTLPLERTENKSFN